MGLKRLITVLLEIYKINKLDFVIIKKKVLKVQMIHSNDDYGGLIVFGKDKKDNIHVTYNDMHNYNKGDIVYQFYLNNIDSIHGKCMPFAMYNTNKYIICDDYHSNVVV